MAFACETEYSWELESIPNNSIVVDAIITNENIAQCIKISLPADSLNAPQLNVSGAIVSVSDGTTIYIFEESPNNAGAYYSHSFQAVVNKTYTLEISFRNKTYTASAKMAPLFSNDKYSIDTYNELFRYNQLKTNEPLMIEVVYDWSAVPEFCFIKNACMAKEFFYILNNVDVNKEIGPNKEVITFPKGTKIYRKKYSLTDEHQAFLRSLLMETEWKGGLFDVQPGNAISNISNGGLGFFAVCTVSTDSLLVY